MKRLLLSIALWCAASVAASAQEAGACANRVMRETKVVVCAIDVARQSVRLLWKNPQGTPYGSLSGIDKAATAETGRMLFAMNAGMYHEDLSPVGLYVEDGKTLHRAITGGGAGNFHMRPNGVFYVDAKGGLGVMETHRFVASGMTPRFASQSGPMLLIGGKLHPNFTGKGTSRKIRNGVGVSPNGRTAWFVISDDPVTFTDFALMFRELGARDALYFDGSISSIYAPSAKRADWVMPVGPIVAGFQK